MELVNQTGANNMNYTTICSNCRKELDGEDIELLDENEGYTSCCNEPTEEIR